MPARHAASALIVLAVAALHMAGATRPLQDWLTELRFGAVERTATGDVVFVAIDPRSLESVGVWPWPRSLHARAVDELLAAGASEIAFDIDFSTPSVEAEDAAFERALEDAGGIVALPTFRQAWSADLAHARVHDNEPIARFARHAWPATVNVFLDPDGRVRSLPFGDTVNGEFRPSIASLYGGIPAGAGTSFLADFSIDPATVPRLSFVDLIAGRVPRGSLSGKKVLIGADAAELRDHFAVPLRGVMSGPMLQIIGAESIMQGRALSAPPLAVTLAMLGLLGLASALLGRRLSWRLYLGVAAVVAVATEGGALAVQAAMPLVVETAPLHLLMLVMCVRVVLGEVDIRGLLLRVARAETRAAREMLDQVVADNFDGIVVIDGGGRVLTANAAAERILCADICGDGRPAGDLLPEALGKHVADIFARFAAGQPMPQEPAEAECGVGAGEAILEFVATPSRLADPGDDGADPSSGRTVVCLTFRDVTERNRARARIAHMAHFDAVTGLANRNRLDAVLDNLLAARGERGDAVAAIYFDLDRFKNVNDTLGHHHGDLLLGKVAERAVPHAGDDGLVARFGGDEFVLVKPGCSSPDAACEIARKLLDELSVPFDVAGHRVIVRGSAGIALSGPGLSTAEALIRCADTALQRAKEEGGHTFRCYEPGYSDRLHHRRQMELDLWKAFERGEFEVFYQPQVDLSDGRLSGAEALLRWNCPVRGYVSPTEFVPVAEDIGLIPDLGCWTLRSACAEAARWPLPLNVAVNLSPHQFRMDDLVATVASALDGAGLEPARLELEITESLFVEENPVTSSVLAGIRDMGIGLALDDFGTGYSALSYIRRFPITRIKIDRSFLSGLPGDAGALAVVRAVTTLSSSLSLSTTAEGIETSAQMDILRLSGCDQGQGYLFGRPMPADDFFALVDECRSGLPLVA